MPDRLITVEETAKRLSVSRSTVYRLVNKGHLHICRVGSLARFAEDEVDEYIQSLKYQPSVFG